MAVSILPDPHRETFDVGAITLNEDEAGVTMSNLGLWFLHPSDRDNESKIQHTQNK